MACQSARREYQTAGVAKRARRSWGWPSQAGEDDLNAVLGGGEKASDLSWVCRYMAMERGQCMGSGGDEARSGALRGCQWRWRMAVRR